MPQVFGESRVNVHALFEQLRKQGELTLIGAETGVAENRFKRCALPQHARHVCPASIGACWLMHTVIVPGSTTSMDASPARAPRTSWHPRQSCTCRC